MSNNCLFFSKITGSPSEHSWKKSYIQHAQREQRLVVQDFSCENLEMAEQVTPFRSEISKGFMLHVRYVAVGPNIEEL
jgi:hypothetical protein